MGDRSLRHCYFGFDSTCSVKFAAGVFTLGSPGVNNSVLRQRLRTSWLKSGPASLKLVGMIRVKGGQTLVAISG